MLTLSGKNGGGQILRSSLTLSMLTGQPFRLTQIRGARPKPGLARQHLTCVKAAAEVCEAAVDGAEMGSTEIIFHPGKIKSGDYHFAIGTAGSTTLLAQTLLPALWQAKGKSALTLEGGTHNPMAPPFDYLSRVYLPTLAKMGITIEASLERYGFVPAGGGRIHFKIPGSQNPQPIEILERGEEIERRIHCLNANISIDVARRETASLLKQLDWHENTVLIESPDNADCPGNVLAAEITFANITERVSTFGAFGKTSKRVAHEVAKMMQNYLNSEAAVGRNLSDQLLLPMALAGGGTLHTTAPSNHLKTNIEVIEKFLPVRFKIEPELRGCHLISVK
ncbi:MAG: RNA 3'-terminal phosphate cyclase (ATP) [Akkermansiaceae bacterium]|jgi:RNA 3'-terminal phosphate cyclase (ATP)